jgi:tRNA G37 N-methylase Trm5
MQTEFNPVHRHLDFMSPLSEQRADKLAQFVATHAGETVVDIGCGWATLLIRILERNSATRGVGIDLNSDGFEHASQVAAARGVADRLQLIGGDAKTHMPASTQGAVCIGATQVWSQHAEANMPLNYAAALTALRKLVVTGSPVLYGEGIWSVAPTERAAAPLAGRLDEFIFLSNLVEVAWNSGFAVTYVHEASQDEWDHFESGYTARYTEWLTKNSQDHPEHAAVLERVRRQQTGYFRGYRGVLGMAYLCLLAI